MTRYKMAAGLLLALTACTPTMQDVNEVRTLSDVNCTTRPTCSYENSPLQVDRSRPVTLPKRPYTFYPVVETLHFRDAQNREWLAPSGTLTDGASIPAIFVSIVGNPTAPEYVNAGAVHDAYCGVGNEGGAMYHNGRWQDVHRMFYDALVAGGTAKPRAQVMFAAVWLGGPRWNYYYSMAAVPPPAMQQAMRDAKSYVEKNDPTLSELILYLERLEKRIIRQYPNIFPSLNPDNERPGGGEGRSEQDIEIDYEPEGEIEGEPEVPDQTDLPEIFEPR